jgi:hypothetical protein
VTAGPRVRLFLATLLLFAAPLALLFVAAVVGVVP